MITLIIEAVTAGIAFAAALGALWHRLRAERYRQRWREALDLGTNDASGTWEVHLKQSGSMFGPSWVVTNGSHSIKVGDCDFTYPSLSKKSREAADQLADELNKGKVKVS